MDIFVFSCYRTIIKNLVAQQRKTDPSITYQDLSQSMRVTKSHLSRVIHGRAELNYDQLYLLCKYFNLKADECEYLRLLVELERTALAERRKILQNLIKETQREKMQTKRHISAGPIPEANMMSYYLDPLHQIVHVAFAIPRYQDNPRLLADDLGVPWTQLERIIRQLEEMRLIQADQNRVKLLIEDLHLPRESVFYRPWISQVKLMSLQRLQHNEGKDAYAFSVTFSADDESRKQILGRFLDFLKGTEQKVKSAAQENVYQMSFELFSWTQP
ncbi:helix-turn-helix domain-containing protein [Oligoflexus tunisiensis]|uniref:helix-turn-helix domain-containing protein n=1 Tax=Oligoflexus tunisiensis TaxID=708132 RepID=UPI00114D396B|nr:helix-turn-helix transcriptional regulator [Oligoflexus tunisiensis]